MQLQQQMAQQPQPQPPPQQPGSPPPPAQQPDPQSAQVQAMLKQVRVSCRSCRRSRRSTRCCKFLKDNRAKAFVLDIETDSTIMADENAEKQRRTEFVRCWATAAAAVADDPGEPQNGDRSAARS